MLAPFDFIIAAEGTRFSFEQARMGSQNNPLGIMAFQFPMRVINQLLLLGGWFDADTAKEIHMVQRVVAADEVSGEVARWAQSASGLTLQTIAAYKEGIHRMCEIAGLAGIIGVGNNLNAHVAGSRGGEFHGALANSDMREALRLRQDAVDDAITKV